METASTAQTAAAAARASAMAGLTATRGRPDGGPTPASVARPGQDRAPLPLGSGAGGPMRLTQVPHAEQLAAYLLDPGRARPVVAVSIAPGRQEPFIRVDEICAQVGPLAEVVVMPTNEVSWAFSSAMPSMTQVYGGSGRVYPVGGDWVGDIRRSPLRFAYSEEDSERATASLIADALTAAGTGSSDTQGWSLPLVSGRVRMTVGDARALVALDEGGTAAIDGGAVVEDVPLDRLLRDDQPVRGRLDPSTRALDVSAMLRPAVETLAHYRVGDTVLGRVTAASEHAVTVAVHPHVIVRVPRARVVLPGPAADLSTYFPPGLVVLAQVSTLVAGIPELSLRLRPGTPEAPAEEPSGEVRPAPVLLEGGPPWLLPTEVGTLGPQAPEGAVEQDDAPGPVPGGNGDDGGAVGGRDTGTGTTAVPGPDPASTAPRPGRPGPRPAEPRRADPDGAGTRPRKDTGADAGPAETPRQTGEDSRPAVRSLGLAVEAARAEVRALAGERDGLAARLEEQTEELTALRGEVELLRADLANAERRAENLAEKHREADRHRQQAVRELRSLREQHAVDDASTPLFGDPAEQFRFDVHLAWARRIPATDKADRPLAAYDVGPLFLRSLDALEGVDRGKVVDVVVEVLTGLAVELAGREVHVLRQGEKGSTPAVTREDGAVCWRASLQRGTPAARRLHYWRLGDRVELSRVVAHDDTEP